MTPELMQDNMSTIKLAEKGKSTSDRTTKEISDLHMSCTIKILSYHIYIYIYIYMN